jgi:hypothetical protein
LTDKHPDGRDAAPGPDAPAAVNDLAAEPVTIPTRPPGRVVSELQAMRDALRARIAGVRAHLAHARNGDHRATVSALAALTDLVREMLGPDSPSDSLRGALADLAAGRTDDAQAALNAAKHVLASGRTPFEARERDAIVAVIGGALHALSLADLGGCSRLTATALDLVEMGA